MDVDLTLSAPFACLETPSLRGWPRLQARLVHHIKRAALRQLHASVAGEILMLRIYLTGEQATESAPQRELNPPAWLAPQVERHIAEEEVHARLFAAAIAERGGKPWAEPSQPDWLSKRKIARWQRLARHHAPYFSQGVLVPAYAIGLCVEQMVTRILQRHCGLIGQHHPMYPLLSRVLADEARHVRMCTYTLRRCVQPHEEDRLALLLREVRDIERGFGVTGAVGMYLAGLALRLRSTRAAAAAGPQELD